MIIRTHAARRSELLYIAMLGLLMYQGDAVAADFTTGLYADIEYTTGDYGGDASVDELYVPVTLVLDVERVSLRVTVPFLSVTAPELTYVDGPDGQPIVGEGPETTESGLGDVLVAMTVLDVLSSSGGAFAVDLTGKIKFGTADPDKGLGTGETDYALQADVFRFFDRLTMAGTAGYWLRGDPPGYDLENTFFVSAGGSYAMTDDLRAGLFYDFRESAIPDSDSIQELSGWVNLRLGNHLRTQVYLLAGFGDSSPDWGAGLSIGGSF